MPRPTKAMTVRTMLVLLLTIALAATMMAAISGDEGTEERTLPTMSVSATGGTTSVTGMQVLRDLDTRRWLGESWARVRFLAAEALYYPET